MESFPPQTRVKWHLHGHCKFLSKRDDMFIDHLSTASYSTLRIDPHVNNSWGQILYSTFISSLVFADGARILLVFQSKSCFVENFGTSTDTWTGFLSFLFTLPYYHLTGSGVSIWQEHLQYRWDILDPEPERAKRTNILALLRHEYSQTPFLYLWRNRK